MAMASAESTSEYDAGWPSLPNDSFSEVAAVAVQSRVLPSMWGEPIPARTIRQSV